MLDFTMKVSWALAFVCKRGEFSQSRVSADMHKIAKQEPLWLSPSPPLLT
jgi:hypothetical protein